MGGKFLPAGPFFIEIRTDAHFPAADSAALRRRPPPRPIWAGPLQANPGGLTTLAEALAMWLDHQAAKKGP